MNETPEAIPSKNKSRFQLFVLAFIGLGLIAYCVFGAINLLSPKVKTPTQTQDNGVPTPSKKAQALIQDSADWDIVFEEQFESDTNLNGWNYGNASTEEMESNIDFKDGKYIWEVSNKNTILVSLAPLTVPELRDFRISADVKLTSGTYKPVYGIVFRDSSNTDYYLFGIYGEGFVISKYRGEDFTRLVDYQKSQAILPQDSNRLTVIGKGSYFVFLINDQFVYELTDKDIRKGGFGYGVGLYVKDLRNSFEFDNFMLQTP